MFICHKYRNTRHTVSTSLKLQPLTPEPCVSVWAQANYPMGSVGWRLQVGVSIWGPRLQAPPPVGPRPRGRGGGGGLEGTRATTGAARARERRGRPEPSAPCACPGAGRRISNSSFDFLSISICGPLLRRRARCTCCTLNTDRPYTRGGCGRRGCRAFRMLNSFTPAISPGTADRSLHGSSGTLPKHERCRAMASGGRKTRLH